MTPSISTETRSVTQTLLRMSGRRAAPTRRFRWRRTSAAARCANASFRRLESRLYPLVALDSVGGRDPRCREALDIDDDDLAADVLGHAICAALHGLMALAQRHVDLASRCLETQILECRDDLLLARPLAGVRDDSAFLEQAPWRALQDQRFGVTAPKARVDDVRTAG